MELIYIYESHFYEVGFDECYGVLVIRVKPESEQMEDEDFQNDISNICDCAGSYDVRAIVFNNIQQQYVISPEMQQWYADYTKVIPWVENIKRRAYVLPKAFIAKLSVEQVSNELSEKIQRIDNEVFDNENDAFEWCKGGINLTIKSE